MAEHVNLRGDSRDAAFLFAVQGVLGFDLPVEANTVGLDPRLRGDDAVAYWLGPDEWLLATRDDSAKLAGQLRAALGAMHASVTEVGAGNVVMVLPASRA